MEKTTKLVGKIILIGVLTGAATYAAYKYLFLGKTHDFDNNAADFNEEMKTSFVKTEKYKQEIARLKMKIYTKTEKKNSTPQLLEITQVIIELYKSKYVPLFLKNRVLRRAYIENKKEYSRIIIEGSVTGEKILEEATYEAMTELGSSVEIYNQEVNKQTESDPRLLKYLTYLFESVKLRIPTESKVNLTPELIVESIDYQIELLYNTDFSEFNDLDTNYIIMCKQAFIADSSAIKFGFEEEDFAKDALLFHNAKVIQKQKELAYKMNNVFRN